MKGQLTTKGELTAVKKTAKKPALTHVLMVVDMSGSMAMLEEDVRGGFNTYLDTLAKEPGDFRLTVTLFDTEFIPLCKDAKLKDVSRLDRKNYRPRGLTALHDAIGKTLQEFGGLKKGERAIAFIQTDGLENASREFSRDAIRKLIKEREAHKDWAFVFLAAGREGVLEGADLGMAGSSLPTSQTAHGTASRYAGMATATSGYSTGEVQDSAGASATIAATPGVLDPAVDYTLGTEIVGTSGKPFGKKAKKNA